MTWPTRPVERWLLAATVVGFVVPNAFVLAFGLRHGIEVGGFFGPWVDRLPNAQLTVDLVICSVAFIGWAAFDSRRHDTRWWVTIPATALVGLCFALPLYLLLRERARAAVA